ncbi:cytochrome oxidase complex assembly protein 1-domain-containing protein [Phlebopus sp. FC_14]|nr:cytochrome oxidase complex assembly protein 1-domain-containing protein [Phlebopus sp. FC_14]
MFSLAQRTRTLAQKQIFCTARRTYSATELPRPPPPTEEPRVETFSAPSKPRLYYARPPTRSDLPHIPKRWPYVLAFAAVGVSGWLAFLLVAMNQERLSSSVVQRILQTVRASEVLREVLGDAIRPEPVWYLNGDPWISGSINLPAGHVDVSFRLKGHRGSGTLYFTSIRKVKGEPFTPLRFRVICDDGRIINVLSPLSSSSSIDTSVSQSH